MDLPRFWLLSAAEWRLIISRTIWHNSLNLSMNKCRFLIISLFILLLLLKYCFVFISVMGRLIYHLTLYIYIFIGSGLTLYIYIYRFRVKIRLCKVIKRMNKVLWTLLELLGYIRLLRLPSTFWIQHLASKSPSQHNQVNTTTTR